MEGAPQGLDVTQLVVDLLANAPIDAVHDVHVWCGGDAKTAGSLHVRVPQINLSQGPEIVSKVKQLLLEKFNIEHSTIEVECDDCESSC